MRLLHALLAVALTFALATCGGDDPAGPAPIDATELAGTWTVELDDGEGRCVPDQQGTIELYFRIEPDDVDFVDDEGNVNVAGDWARDEAFDLDFAMSGHFNVERRDYELNLFHRFPDPKVELTGTIESTDRLVGRFVDTGSHWLDRCSGDAVATK